MLKALELIGFKSFADKTRFEFPAGITVVVGPNGSGKSNVVDAIKWVLGEQSAKSLRGKDMSDVIFKGSGGGAGGRKAMNTAEATIIIDNSTGQLPIDAPEVHVSRRVYRSGEGEYLINRQPCRLKDVRDLFRGTGVGTDAYSLIEQGKVDRLLQASPKDRRAIFEEAAGISRFKAKKIEAQRRLERVDQNLLRLSDIVEEVENRLKSVRSQASKARRYKEYSDRLQQLRTQVGLADWRSLTGRLETIEGQLSKLRDQAATIAAETEAVEARSLEMEIEIGDAGEAIRSCENLLARNRERIATQESTITHQRSRCHDLDEEESRLRQQLSAMSTRAGDLQQRLQETSAALAHAEGEYRQIGQRLAEQDAVLSQLTTQIDQLRVANEQRRQLYVERMRAAAMLGNHVSALESQLAASESSATRSQRRLEELQQELTARSAEYDQLHATEQHLTVQAEQQNAALEVAQNKLDAVRRELVTRQDDLAQLKGRYSGASQRAQVLDDLEKKLEGLSTGVKEVLAEAKHQPDGPYGEVRGLVADLIQADVAIAPLVDIALGDRAQHVVVAGGRLRAHLASPAYRVGGRVGFIHRDQASADNFDGVDLHGLRGVIGRADRQVRTADEFTELASRLLGKTWFVEELSDALELSQTLARGLRIVTRGGQLIEEDGTIVVGPKHVSVGLVSRRSELRALKLDIREFEKQIAELQAELVRRHAEIEQQEQHLRELAAAAKAAEASLADARLQVLTARQRFEQTQKERDVTDAELRAARVQHATATQQLAIARAQVAAAESEISQLESEIAAANHEMERLEPDQRNSSREATATRIELAKSEQRLENLRIQMKQFESDQRERSRAVSDARARIAESIERRRETERRILQATAEVAELYLQKEGYTAETSRHFQRRDELSNHRSTLAETAQRNRKAIRKLEEQQHQADLDAGEIRHERHTLADRLREDYGIEIEQLTSAATADDQQERAAVEEEIASLRRKINNIGAVNMEALAELEELEDRFATLSGQHRDLTQAKDSLERIIHKINADSRRLFTETLEAIRINFQALYRKAFGGGKADIVLEEGEDILEAGVEIIATPPGKPQFNNSLLSGGEKALTAVSLLLAIFQYRPSPFCVLDEVDAPFDEANVGRFIDVLKDFLGWTKFVIVTHSKKTMTAATTLYGVTMQESGISKQVSVRFEDVSEDGHISHEAVTRETINGETAEDEQAA